MRLGDGEIFSGFIKTAYCDPFFQCSGGNNRGLETFWNQGLGEKLKYLIILPEITTTSWRNNPYRALDAEISRLQRKRLSSVQVNGSVARCMEVHRGCPPSLHPHRKSSLAGWAQTLPRRIGDSFYLLAGQDFRRM